MSKRDELEAELVKLGRRANGLRSHLTNKTSKEVFDATMVKINALEARKGEICKELLAIPLPPFSMFMANVKS